MDEKPKTKRELDSISTIGGTTFVGTYQKGHEVTLETLINMLSNLPEPPTIYAMEYKTFRVIPNEALSNNTIIVSMDFAKKMGWLDDNP